jgi:hypothetical protein
MKTFIVFDTLIAKIVLIARNQMIGTHRITPCISMHKGIATDHRKGRKNNKGK